MNYTLLHQILELVEKFEQHIVNPEKSNIQNFSFWLQQQFPDDHLAYKAPPLEEEKKSVPLQGGTNAQISQLIVLMNKYVKYYIRKAFQDTPLSSPDDFGFLATLIFYGDMQKTELIQRNTSELTSGMEVIKRLEKNGLIRSFDDTKDHRAKRIAATDKGIETFAAVMPAMQQIGVLAMGDLNVDEQNQLLILLNKLNIFHQPIFHESKKAEWEEMVQEYLM